MARGLWTGSLLTRAGRRALTLVACAGGCALWSAAPAPAANTSELEVAVTPARASTSARQLRDVAISFTTLWSTDGEFGDDSVVSPVRQARLFAARGFVFNARYFPKCDPYFLSIGQPGRCGAARVGFGSARLAAYNPSTRGLTTAVASVRAFNATRGGRPGLLLYLTSSQGIIQQSVIGGTFLPASGAYGTLLSLSAPLSSIFGYVVSIEALHVRLHGRVRALVRPPRRKGQKKAPRPQRRLVSYVTTPLRCPSGGWPFFSSTAFHARKGRDAGPRVLASVKVPCTR